MLSSGMSRGRGGSDRGALVRFTLERERRYATVERVAVFALHAESAPVVGEKIKLAFNIFYFSQLSS